MKKKYKQKKNINSLRKILHSRVFQSCLVGLAVLTVILLWVFREHLPTSSKYGYFGIFMANLVASSTLIVPLPGVATVFLGGSLWNPVLVGLVSGLGSMIGEIVGYLAGYGGRRVIADLNRKTWLIHLEGFFRKNGFLTIFLVSLIPNPFFDFIGLLSGALKYPMWKYMLANFMGRSIRNIVIAWTGAKFLPF